MASKLQVMKYRKWNNCCAEQNSPRLVCVLYILKEDGLPNGDGFAFGFISVYPIGEKKCKTFPFIFNSILSVGCSQAGGVLMGFCLIINWHNKNGMRMGRARVPLGWTRGMCWGWEHSRLMGMRMEKSTGPLGWTMAADAEDRNTTG